jgi:integrase
MKAVLNTAVGQYLDVNPLASVKRKTDKVKPKRTLTAAEDRALLKALRAVDEEIADMYVVGVGTLLRQENLLYLKRGEHRGDRLVVHTKTGPHSVPLKGPTPLQRRAAAVLKRRMPKKADGYFFPTWKAKFAPYEDSGHPRVLFLKKVKRAVKQLEGVPWGLDADGVVWHTMTRASGATRLLRDYKVDVRTVQLIGGWSSLDQMAQYLGIDRDLLFG